jgi:4-hydroxy-tetrahydrodipicolinate synthase
MSKLITGVYAAVGAPRDEQGCLDEGAFARGLEFVLERGIGGFALNGATGEYCLTTVEELGRLLRIARATAPHAEILCGVGSAGIHDCIAKGNLAMSAGAKALLLPMPHFFPYAQDDLEAFCEHAASVLNAPILLYNLPLFTTGIELRTALDIIRNSDNIIGIKDSGGSLGILRALTGAGLDACRMVGHDGVFAAALSEGIADGIISGIAGVVPELILGLYSAAPGSTEFAQYSRLLDQFVSQMAAFPTPWALKWIGECRSVAKASFSQPLSPRRLQQGKDLQRWFTDWWSVSSKAM